MSVSYLLAPIPKWIIMNNDGDPAGGAYLYTYRSLNPVEEKPVYQDSGGTLTWTNPIIFDANGTQGPFYWAVDSADLSDTYYLEAWTGDKNDPNSGATLIWTIDDYFPPGSGGGGNTTTYVPIVNYISNNQFIDHIDDMTVPANLTNTVIAPSNHKGFTPALINPVNSGYGTLGPDIRFVKNDTGLSSDQIDFPLFALSSYPLTDDVTPVDYVRYRCSGSPAGESFKSFQFPITQKVKNLSNTEVTFRIWAKVAATPVTLNVYALQYFGSGTAASSSVQTSLDTITLTTDWTAYLVSGPIPTVAGKSLGTPGQQTDDDALYIQLGLPLGTNCEVWFCKPSLYLGADINPDSEFDTYDEINAVNSTPRTGDIKTSLLSSSPQGWVAMNDGSIGNSGSGATTRANQDTFQLYKTIWDGVLDAWAPVSTGRGATAIADFIAGKTLTLPRSLGRSLSGAGSGTGLTPRVLGEYAGSESNDVTISGTNLPPHTHTVSTNAGTNVTGATNVVALAQTNSTTYSGFNVGNGPGSSTPLTIPSVTPSSYFNVFIKL